MDSPWDVLGWMLVGMAGIILFFLVVLAIIYAVGIVATISDGVATYRHKRSAKNAKYE